MGEIGRGESRDNASRRQQGAGKEASVIVVGGGGNCMEGRSKSVSPGATLRASGSSPKVS